MIEYSKILEKIEQGNLLYRDKDGDTLLHSLIKAEEYMIIPIKPVQLLLSKHPELIDKKNKAGFTPVQLLDSYQLHTHVSNRPLRHLLYKHTTDKELLEKLEKSIEMSFVEQLTEKENDKKEYRIIPQKEGLTLLDKPILLLFSGRGNFALPLINGFGRKIRKRLGVYTIKTPQLPIVSVRYPGNQRDLCNDWLSSHAPTPDKPDITHPVKYIRSFVHKYLRPLYISQAGEKQPVLSAMKNLRHINMIGYSYGSAVIQLLSEEMTKDMLQSGFSDREVAKIQSQILVFHIAPDLTKFHYQNYFTSYHMINTKDDVMWDHVKELLPDVSKTSDELIKTTLGNQKNNKCLLINTLENNTDNPPHHINTYCFQGNIPQRTALLWMKSIILNGINNSIQNEGSARLIPLPNNLESPQQTILPNLKTTPIAEISPQAYCKKVASAKTIRQSGTSRIKE